MLNSVSNTPPVETAKKAEETNLINNSRELSGVHLSKYIIYPALGYSSAFVIQNYINQRQFGQPSTLLLIGLLGTSTPASAPLLPVVIVTSLARKYMFEEAVAAAVETGFNLGLVTAFAEGFFETVFESSLFRDGAFAVYEKMGNLTNSVISRLGLNSEPPKTT